MGIPKFYRWISERYPCLSEVINETQVPEFDCLYLDMNGIIHVCSHPSDDVHFRMSEKEMFVDICRYIEVLFRIISPKKTFFMAVDGVAPRAKMNQQRARRFKSAKDMEKKEEEAKSKGEVLPEEAPFDSNCITPGTEFMDRLHDQLKYFTAKKVSTDEKWQNVQIILSGHDVPGEGEHKIMDFIRSERARPDYNPNTRHCMYGLDADLIMLGLCSHEPHFSLLREEVRFGKFAQHGKQSSRVSNADRTTFHLLHLSLLREYLEMEFTPLKELLSFDFDIERIIDDWVLMGFLVGNDFIPHLPYLHINRNALPTLFETYLKVLPQLDGYLNERGILSLERFEKYCRALAEIDRDYFDEMNEDMQWFKSKRLGDAIIEHHETHISPNNQKPKAASASTTVGTTKSEDRWLQKLEGGFLFDEDDECEALEPEKETTDPGNAVSDALANATEEQEITLLTELFGEDCRLGKKHRKTKQSDEEEDLEVDDANASQENEADISNDELEYLSWKRSYYIDKFKVPNPSRAFIRKQVELYVRAIQWNLHYYYHGVQSWSWFYSEHYAPFVSDLKNFQDVDMHFPLAKPFKPFEQLLGVLPARSKALLPETYRCLMTDGPIAEFYPSDFQLDLNGKQMDWEAVVLIPFIDESRLLEAMEKGNQKLTAAEKERNEMRHNLVFVFSRRMPCFVYPAVSYFPEMKECRAQITKLDTFAWAIPVHLVKHGLVDGVRLDVYFEGFPTMKHLNYKSRLSSEGIKVFQCNSRGQSMIITISAPPAEIQTAENVKELFFGQSKSGSSIFVRWPYLKEAKVVSVSDSSTRYKLAEGGTEVVCEQMSMQEQIRMKNEYNRIVELYHDKRGVHLEPLPSQTSVEEKKGGENLLIVEVVELVGKRNIYNSRTGKVSLEPQYARNIDVYPFQLCVYGIESLSRQVTKMETLADMFPVGSRLFVLALKFYGEEGTVMNCTDDGMITFKFSQKVEPNFNDIIQNKESLSQYYSQFEAAQQLGIAPLLLNRITGSLLVSPPVPPLPEDTDGKDAEKETLPNHSGPETPKKTSKVNGFLEKGTQQSSGWCQNIGLNLKFTKSNEEVMGFTKRVSNDRHTPYGGGSWLYSEKCIAVVREYMDRYPEMFTRLSQNISGDRFSAERLFGEEKTEQKLNEVLEYLKTVSCAKAKKISSNSQILEEQVLVQIQNEIERCNIANYESQKTKTVKASPDRLFRPLDLNGSIMPDESTQFRMFDRVVNVRDGFCVPVGLRGTIIGLPCKRASTSRDAMLDVLFDEPFLGAHQAMPGTWFSAYRVPAASLINLSHGIRLSRKDTNSKNQTEVRNLPSRSNPPFPPRNDLVNNENLNAESTNSGAGAPLPGGIKQLLSQARAAAENEKMYQKSKQNQSNGYQSSSNMQWSSNFSQTPNQPQMLHAQQNQQQESNNLLMDLLQQMQQKDASQSMPPMMSSNSHTSNSGAQGFEQLFQQMHLRQNSYEQQHHTPSNQMLFGPQNNGNDFYRNNNFYDQHNYQPNPGKQSFKRFKQPWEDGTEFSHPDLTSIDVACGVSRPLAELYERHRTGNFSKEAKISFQNLTTGVACNLEMLDKNFDGPICENEFEALTEASVGFVKFVNSRELQKRNEMYAAAPGLYTPQNFHNPMVPNHQVMLLNERQQVLVPGQVSQQFFTPDSFNPNFSQQQQESTMAAAGLYNMNQQHASPSLFARQSSAGASGSIQQPYPTEGNTYQKFPYASHNQSSTGGPRGKSAPIGRGGRGRSSHHPSRGQKGGCAMSFGSFNSFN